MGTEYDELGALGRDLAIWEIHLRSTSKSTHTIGVCCQVAGDWSKWALSAPLASS